MRLLSKKKKNGKKKKKQPFSLLVEAPESRSPRGRIGGGLWAFLFLLEGSTQRNGAPAL